MKAIMMWRSRDVWKRWLIMLYFCVSFMMLCIGDESPLWAIALVVANFAVAVWLARVLCKVQARKIEFEDCKELKENEV